MHWWEGLSEKIPHLSIWSLDGDPAFVIEVCVVCTEYVAEITMPETIFTGS
jgi:hypothetical protein